MRRDLTLGCATCRLRFSSQLKRCPVCRSAASTSAVPEAAIRAPPTSRAAWLAKWVITLTTIPAIGIVLWMGGLLLHQGWPPQNAAEMVMIVLGAMSICLAAGILVAIPLAIWVGLVAIIRFVLQRIVDRPRQTLRISIEMSPRVPAKHEIHPMHRLWDKLETFVRHHMDNPKTFYVISAILFFGLQIIAQIFGKASLANDFITSLVMLGVVNVMGAVILVFILNIFGQFVKLCYDFLSEPPNLFGYDPNPPALRNEACLALYLRDRQEVVGRVAPLDAAECGALGVDADTPLRSPLSGQTCFAFRLVGEADGQLVDDADATNFAVIGTDNKRYVVTNADFVAYLPAEKRIAARDARGFIAERGLPERDLDLREGLLCEGDLVRVVGRHRDIRIGSAGYRGDERRVAIDAGDGLPVVIRGHEKEHG